MISREEANRNYAKILKQAAKDNTRVPVMRNLCKRDLFFLLTVVCNREDINRDWLYARCREVQLNPNGYLDLWSREHYKSTIITFGMSILDILNNPEVTIGIFSYKTTIAQDFLKQIKRELEENDTLKKLFPDILYEKPHVNAPKWNESGIIVKRKTNPNADTVSAWGMVDSQPTSKHFGIIVIDDAVTERSVTSEDTINKTLKAWENAQNLSSDGGYWRHIGTRYHYNDLWGTILERNAATPRIYTATDDGTPDGTPVLWSKEYHDQRRNTLSPYVYSCQILQNPKADNTEGFEEPWLRFWAAKNFRNMNIYIIVDPAKTKTKRSDYTAILVIGYAEDGNYYIIDMYRDRLSLYEKAKLLMRLDRKYRPIRIGYEVYGAQSDVQAMEMYWQDENYNFTRKIVELKGTHLSKEDRIKKLIVPFRQNRIFLPYTCVQTNYEGESMDVVKQFIEAEYNAFPFGKHDDMLDCLSRIMDNDMRIKKPLVMTHKKTHTRSVIEYDVFGA